MEVLLLGISFFAALYLVTKVSDRLQKKDKEDLTKED